MMPEHVHLLIREQERGDPSLVMKALNARGLRAAAGPPAPVKGRLDAAVPGTGRAGRIWQPRFYDFVVFSEHKRVEKLRYMHRNPVKRGLVLAPERRSEQVPPPRLR